MATDRARLGPGDSSLSPELVAQRGFLTARRGFDPEEVKAFLAKVANELRTMRHREAALERALSDAEARAAHPTIDENMLLSALGEETASILRSAHAAAADIRTKAEDNAARILKEGHDQATAMRGDADTILGKRTAEAEALAGRITEAARADADRTREAARQAAEAIRAQADAERKVTIEAAQGARERILNDLTRRRKVAMVQIEQLRAGRERLLEAYKVVRRTLDEVSAELQRADGEARSAAEAAGRRQPPEMDEVDPGPVTLGEPWHEQAAPPGGVGSPGPEPIAVSETPGSGAPGDPAGGDARVADDSEPHQHDPGGSGGPPDSAGPPVAAGRASTRVAEERRLTSLRVLRRQKEPKEGTERPNEPPRPSNGEVLAAIDSEGAASGQEQRPDPPADVETPAGSVDGLFARIRADREQDVANARQVLAQPRADVEGDQGKDTAADSAATNTAADSAATNTAADSAATNTAAESAATNTAADSAANSVAAEAETDRTPAADEAILQRRDEAVGPLEASLARKLKRVLQDEQNDMLDRLRGLRTPPTAALLLPAPDAHVVPFAQAGRPLLDKAAKAGASFAASLAGPSAPAAAPEMPDLDDLAADLASAVVEPLRRRLEQAFTDAHDDDEAVLAGALGAAYREWKTQRIEQTAADHVASAFARGAFAATPEGTPLRWLVEDVNGPCPDCDDNALAGGLIKGEPFPTGQRFPPAHAGCRCLLVPPSG